MDHDHLTAAAGPSATLFALLIRIVLMLFSSAIVGAGLFRPVLETVSRRVIAVVAALAAVVVGLVLTSVFALDVDPIGGAIHVVLTVLVAVAFGRWPVAARWAAAALLILLVLEAAAGRPGIEFALDTGYVAAATVWFGVTLLTYAAPVDTWRTTSLRLRPLALSLAVVLVVCAAFRIVASDIGFDRRLFGTPFGLALLAVLILPLLVLAASALPRFRTASAENAYRLGAVGVAAGFLAWTALAGIAKPADLPVPAAPLLASAQIGEASSPVLVSPHRPGTNLVHFPESAGKDITVTVEGGERVVATRREGSQGTWAQVELPEGRSELTVARGDAETTLDVDAGDGDALPSASGADGAECASAALGRLVVGTAKELTTCPSDDLGADDERALRSLLDFLAERKTPSVEIVEDASPRGKAAARVVRAAAKEHDIDIVSEATDKTALVVASGFEPAHAAVTRAGKQQTTKPVYAQGIYLAPWLLGEPVANAVTTTSGPLRFDPREPSAVEFTVEIGNTFGGERPTVGAYREWLREQGRPTGGEVRVYATAQVNVMQMAPGERHAPGMDMVGAGPGHWISNSTIVPISLPLDERG